MAQQEPTMPTTCDYCGKPFNTSRQHPRKYCSIACEEGRGTLPASNPESAGYPQYIQGVPVELVGRTVIAVGAKYDQHIGEVIDFDGNTYTIERENIETGEITHMEYNATAVLHQIKNERWWVE